jgi:hypothetical protein
VSENLENLLKKREIDINFLKAVEIIIFHQNYSKWLSNVDKTMGNWKNWPEMFINLYLSESDMRWYGIFMEFLSLWPILRKKNQIFYKLKFIFFSINSKLDDW